MANSRLGGADLLPLFICDYFLTLHFPLLFEMITDSVSVFMAKKRPGKKEKRLLFPDYKGERFDFSALFCRRYQITVHPVVKVPFGQ